MNGQELTPAQLRQVQREIAVAFKMFAESVSDEDRYDDIDEDAFSAEYVVDELLRATTAFVAQEPQGERIDFKAREMPSKEWVRELLILIDCADDSICYGRPDAEERSVAVDQDENALLVPRQPQAV